MIFFWIQINFYSKNIYVHQVYLLLLVHLFSDITGKLKCHFSGGCQICGRGLVTDRIRIWGKVLFSQACVIHSVHRDGVCGIERRCGIECGVCGGVSAHWGGGGSSGSSGRVGGGGARNMKSMRPSFL